MGKYPISEEANAKLFHPFQPVDTYARVFTSPGGPTVYMRPVGKLTPDKIQRLVDLNAETALEMLARGESIEEGENRV